MKSWEKQLGVIVDACVESAKKAILDNKALRLAYKEAKQDGSWGDLSVIPEGSDAPDGYVLTDYVIYRSLPYDNYRSFINSAAYKAPIIGACD